MPLVVLSDSEIVVNLTLLMEISDILCIAKRMIPTF